MGKLGIRSIVVAVAVVSTTAACGGGGSGGSSSGASAQGGAPIKIGVINPSSGALAAGGLAVTQGYEVAADEINAKGGINGRKVQLVSADASTPDAGISEVNRLATSGGVDMFMGTYISAVSNTASQTAARYNKLYWETNSLASDLTGRGLTNYVRSGPDATNFAQVSVDGLAKLALPNIGKQISGARVCITHEQSSYGTSIADTQKQLLQKDGATVTDDVAYDPSAPDLGNVIVRCQNANSDVWLSTGYVPDSNLLLRTAAQQGFKPGVTMMVGSADTSETLKAVPDNVLTGVYVTVYTHSDASASYTPGMKDFLAAYKKKFGQDPTFPQTTAAYTGAKILFQALAKAKSTDPAAVRKAAATLDQPLGSTAAGFGIKFDKNFQNTRALPTVLQWQSGKTVTLYPDNAAASGAKPVKPQS